jgi:hypothetical protein
VDESRQQRVDHSNGRQSNAQRIDRQRPVEVLDNHRTAPTGGFDGCGELPQIVSNQEHIRAGMGDFRSTAHCHAYMGVGERGSIVDAVSDHGNCSAQTNQLFHTGRLSFWQQAAGNLTDSDTLGNRLGGCFGVTSE